MIPIQSFGAAETVTGSCHLVSLENGPNILIDCGMFQGALSKHNRDEFGFNPAEVDILLITHAHLDHVGRIPKLVKEGFKGRIIATRATMELAEVVLMDSAKIMEEDYATAIKKAERRGEASEVLPSLYRTKDVATVFNLSIQYASYDQSIKLTPEVQATFRNAGHILGSSTIELDFKENNQPRTIVFSGDLGNNNNIVMPSPEAIKKSDALYIESTYGDRNHKSTKDSISEFKTIVTQTLNQNGNVIIPSFAIERTQEILIILKQMYYEGSLPKCKVFLDSPMAIRATQIYNQHHFELNEMASQFLEKDGSIFDFPYLQYMLKGTDSQKINEEASRCIIIAGSGMCTGGRILHHFKQRLWNEKNAIIFVGYQAEGTLGRILVNGAEFIKIYHEKIKVGASISMINGFSAHADQTELLDWINQFEKLEKVFLIHGEPDKQSVFKQAIKEKLHKTVHIVKQGEKIWV